MCSDKDVLGLPRRVSPFGNLRIKAWLTAPRSLWQPSASFIAYWCQGIHQKPFTINYKIPIYYITIPYRILNLQIFQRSQENFLSKLLVTQNLQEGLTLHKEKVKVKKIRNKFTKKIGGDERSRTADLPRAKRTLYQLSYTPAIVF